MFQGIQGGVELRHSLHFEEVLGQGALHFVVEQGSDLGGVLVDGLETAVATALDQGEELVAEGLQGQVHAVLLLADEVLEVLLSRLDLLAQRLQGLQQLAGLLQLGRHLLKELGQGLDVLAVGRQVVQLFDQTLRAEERVELAVLLDAPVGEWEVRVQGAQHLHLRLGRLHFSFS